MPGKNAYIKWQRYENNYHASLLQSLGRILGQLVARMDMVDDSRD